MNELRALWDGFGNVMIDNQPVLPVKTRFEGQVTYPGGFFLKRALPPIMIVIRFKTRFFAEKFCAKALQQNTRDEAVQVALVSADNFGFGKNIHPPDVSADR